MAERLDIPAECFEPKPIFDKAPTREIVDEVRAWVKKNPTYMWRGHTHSRPDKEEAGQIQYVNDFVLPKGVESPCPCCTQYHAKFGKGYIAWFPLTRNVRLMGQDCFRTLNPEGHDFAVNELDARIKREAEQEYLLANVHKIPGIINTIRAAKPIAACLDDLREILGPKLIRMMEINLWSHVRTGSLDLIIETADGPAFTPYATVTGTGLLNPNRRSYVVALDSAELLITGNIDLPFDPIKASDIDRQRTAKVLARATRAIRETLAAMADARLFVSVTNTATLRNWAEQENAPAQFYIRREDRVLHIGKSEKSAHALQLNPLIDRSVPRLAE
jgi:hypothetical protein